MLLAFMEFKIVAIEEIYLICFHILILSHFFVYEIFKDSLKQFKNISQLEK